MLQAMVQAWLSWIHGSWQSNWQTLRTRAWLTLYLPTMPSRAPDALQPSMKGAKTPACGTGRCWVTIGQSHYFSSSVRSLGCHWPGEDCLLERLHGGLGASQSRLIDGGSSQTRHITKQHYALLQVCCPG